MDTQGVAGFTPAALASVRSKFPFDPMILTSRSAMFERWARHLVSSEDLRKRAERLRNLRREEPKRPAKKGQLKCPRRPSRYRCTDSGPMLFGRSEAHACRDDELERQGCVEYAAALGLLPPARIWRDRLEDSGDEMALAIASSSECPGSIKQRC